MSINASHISLMHLGAGGKVFGYISEGTTSGLRADKAKIQAMPANDPQKREQGKLVTAAKVSNVVKVLAYIPIIGTIIGFARMIFAGIAMEHIKKSNLSPEEKEIALKNSKQLIGRGLVEMIPGSGLILAPVDACVAIRDYSKLKAARKAAEAGVRGDLTNSGINAMGGALRQQNSPGTEATAATTEAPAAQTDGIAEAVKAAGKVSPEFEKVAKDAAKIFKEMEPAMQKMGEIMDARMASSPELTAKVKAFEEKIQRRFAAITPAINAVINGGSLQDLFEEKAVKDLVQDIQTEVPGLFIEAGVKPQVVQAGVDLVVKTAGLIEELAAGKFDGLKGLIKDLKEFKNVMVKCYP